MNPDDANYPDDSIFTRWLRDTFGSTVANDIGQPFDDLMSNTAGAAVESVYNATPDLNTAGNYLTLALIVGGVIALAVLVHEVK